MLNHEVLGAASGGRHSQPDDLTEDLLATVKEIAPYGKWTERQAYALIEKGHIPTVKVGNRIYSHRSWIDALFSKPKQFDV